MLQTLLIKNVAVIDSVEIEFKQGLNILSGETGAGKSIVIEAIGLLLGARAHAELIRKGCDEAIVEGVFFTGELPWLPSRLKELGFETQGAESELLIKRVVNRNGRHRIFVNGQLSTLALLQELTVGLVDLCGQHEHQTLLRSQTQLELLDRFGELMPLSSAFSLEYFDWQSLVAEAKRLGTEESERARRQDYLKFQLQELNEAAVQPGEDEKLTVEKQLLQSSEQRVQSAEGAYRLLENDEGGVLQSLRTALQRVRQLVVLDSCAAGVRDSLERALTDIEDAHFELGKYLNSIELDPSRLEQVQERLSLLADLRRKYGGSIEAILESQAKVEIEFREVGEVTGRLALLEQQTHELESKLKLLAETLTQKRVKAAKALALSVTDELRDLNMTDAEFFVQLKSHSEVRSFRSTGADDVSFEVRTNKGEEARALGKIASGGELSRLMLAIRRVIADRGGIGVYLFDEIDAGIGGQTAFQVGKKLKSVALTNQVLCITHLAQVAAFADHHLSVRKTTQDDRTRTEVVDLGSRKDRSRQEELARMMSGPKLTTKSIENAAELLLQAR